MDAITFYSQYFDYASLENIFTRETSPWNVIEDMQNLIRKILNQLSLKNGVASDIFIHPDATVEKGAIIKGPAIISANCFIGFGTYVRNGVLLAENVSIGPHCEVKQSIILPDSRLAHFNFVGNSIIGSDVNFEAGAHTANHWNEREDKNIWVKSSDTTINTGLTKFGAIVGDSSRIGANAVLSPGTLLEKKSIVPRLGLINQIC
jgi:NDP-sugar pyrophosphorylase family protein